MSSNDTPAAKPKARRASSTQKYVRNLYGSPLGLRISKDERFELKPRGMRGDLIPVSKDQESKLAMNIGVTVELISEAEARKVVEGQATNQQTYHPAIEALRNELGEEYAQDEVELTDEIKDQGVTAAYLDKDGNIVTQRVDGKGQQMVRDPRPPARHTGPNLVNVPGSDAQMTRDLEMERDAQAKLGNSLGDVLGGFDVER